MYNCFGIKSTIRVNMDEFDQWNNIKRQTDKAQRNVGFRQRDIFWTRVGKNIGFEEYGKGNEFQRPVLIVRKLTSNIFIGLPLTSSIRDNDYFYSFSYNSKKGLVENSAMILQVRTFDKRRLMGKIGTMNKEDFNNTLEKIRRLFIPPN